MGTDAQVSSVNVAASGTTQHASSVESIVSSFEEADHQTVDLSGHTFDDWLCLGLFWIMGLLVFVQFFTRYVMNDSFAWTEELATYSLIGVVFIGAAMCVRTSRHIQVDLLYRYLPHAAGRVLSTLIDVARTVFLAYVCWLVWEYIQLVGEEPMTTIEWNKAYVYWLALFGFVLMAARSLQVTVQNWRQGYSNLERPEAYDKLD
jgi:TRAP-type C4-dicarboxylate transport system permease small subunit